MLDRNDDAFEGSIPADTPEEWNRIRTNYQQEFVAQAAWTIPLGLELVFNGGGEIDANESAVVSAFSDAPKNSLWVERYCEPSFELAPNLYGVSQTAYQLLLVTQPTLPAESNNLYQSKNSWQGSEDPPFTLTWVVMRCPRCEMLKNLDEEDFDDDEVENPNCPACEGAGEWEFELPNI